MTALEGELTAPKSAPSHSFLRISTVLSGRAAPVFSKVSNPASRSTNSNFSLRDAGRASRIRRPAGITSLPIPSPGIRPICMLDTCIKSIGGHCTYAESSCCHCVCFGCCSVLELHCDVGLYFSRALPPLSRSDLGNLVTPWSKRRCSPYFVSSRGASPPNP